MDYVCKENIGDLEVFLKYKVNLKYGGDYKNKRVFEEMFLWEDVFYMYIE